MHGRIKQLLNNTIIFGLGTLFSKLFQYILLIIITYKLSTSEYGTADLIIQAYTILFPIVSLDMSEAILRFVMNKNYEKKDVLNTVLWIDCIGICICILVGGILCVIFNKNSVICTVVILTVLNVFYWSFREYTRGIDKYRSYSLGAVLGSVVQVVMCLVLVFWLDLGLIGYMYAIGISLITETLFYVVTSKAYYVINIQHINKKYAKDMIQYSLPLIPNAICWWIVSVSDRFMVSFFIDESANGLYAVASKLPALLTMISTFFIQAWQTSSIMAIEDKESPEFFDKVYNALAAFIIICGSIALLIVKPIMLEIFPDNYHSAWMFVPTLMIAAIFNVFQSFLSTILLAANKTIKVFSATIIAALLNITLNCVLIPQIGIQGACISTLVSFLVLCIFRQHTLKDYLSVDIIKQYIVSLGLLIMQMLTVLFDRTILLNILICVVTISLTMFVNRNKLKLGRRMK